MKHYRLVAISAFMTLAVPTSHAQNPTPDQTQDRLQQMQTTMDQMPQAKTPAERRKLMGKHIELMQEQMSGMRSMMGGKTGQGGMMGGTMDPGATTAGVSTATDPKVAVQIHAIEQRMDMMQRLMEQMVQEQKNLWANG